MSNSTGGSTQGGRSRSRFLRLAAWCGMFAVGIAWAFAAAVITLFVTFAGSESPETDPLRLDIILVFSLLVGAPAFLFWKKKGLARGLAIGLALCWVFGVIWTFAVWFTY